MNQFRETTWSLWVGAAVGLCLFLSFSDAGAGGDGLSAIGPATSEATAKANSLAGTERVEGQVPPASWSSEGSPILRNVPTVSKQIAIGRTTLVPYVGVGFGSGYASDLDRSLNTAPSTSPPSDSGLRSLFGQGLMPNEFQLGIRLPF